MNRVPAERTSCDTFCCAPLPSATIVSSAATPMTMPSIVSSVRSLLRRRPRTARRTLVASTSGPCDNPAPLVLSLSKDERAGSWFDELTTSGSFFAAGGHATLLAPEGFDRIQRRRLPGREPAEEDADGGGDADREQHRAGRNGRRPFEIPRQAGSGGEAERDAHD